MLAHKQNTISEKHNSVDLLLQMVYKQWRFFRMGTVSVFAGTPAVCYKPPVVVRSGEDGEPDL